jgi:hypothetical protein
MAHTISDSDKERLDFYAAVGEAITKWANIEGALLNLLSRLLRAEEFQPLSAGYYSMVSFKAQLAFIDAVAMYVLEKDEDIIEWNAIFNKLGRASDRRNALAHLSAEFAPQRKPGKRYTLGPHLYDQREESLLVMIDLSNPRYTTARVCALVRSFDELQKRIGRFYGRFEPRPSKLDRLSRPLIRNRRSRIRALVAQRNAGT